MANEIISEMRNGALIITFNCADQATSFNGNMAGQLFQILKPVAQDKAIRAVMLRGAGEHFMDGLDLDMYAKDTATGAERNNELLLPYHSAIRELHGMDKPVLAVVQGRVSGPGLSFMLASDLVLAGRSAKFNAQFTSYAMTPDGGASFFLTRKLGAAKATEILMLSEEFDAAMAEKLQLVNAVVDDAALQAQSLEWIDRLAAGPTRAFGGVKRLVSKAYEHDLPAQLALEHTYWGVCSRSFDFRSAIKGLFMKQPVKYTGA